MRKLSFLLIAALLLVSALPAFAQAGDIVDIAVADGRFTTLVAAVQAAGLVDTLQGEGPFTVFAPTDDAFAAALGELNIDPAALLADTELLTNILLYHVGAGKAMAADVVGLESVTTVQGSDISIKVENGSVYLNDTVQVIITDIEASNGVIHVVDSVILPPAYARNLNTNNLNFRVGPGLDQQIQGSFASGAIAEVLGRDASSEWLNISYDGMTGWVFAPLTRLSVDIVSLPVIGEEAGTIVDIAAANADFSTLVAAVQAAGLVDALNGEGPYTVFAPTNEAFAAALETLGISAEDLLADTETLPRILLYHVVEGKVMAADVVGLSSAPTLQGGEISIAVRDGSVFLNDNIQVVATDIEASNGVIHVINGVLLPPQ